MPNSSTTPVFGTNAVVYNQSCLSFDASTFQSGWAHYLTFNHENGETYYHYNVAFPFWDVPYYKRQTGNTSSQTQWYKFLTEENCKIGTSAYSPGGTGTKFGLWFNTGTRV